jgi:hypothetical protein
MKELPDLVLAFGNSDEYRYAARLHWKGPSLRHIAVPVSSPNVAGFGLYMGRSMCFGSMLTCM